MQQNIYDDPDFFERYSRMPRSVSGLSAAGEWETLRGMLGSLQGKRVLDLGCGYGWHCIHAYQQGAARVVGVDLSEKMLERARELAGSMDITFRRMAIEDISLLPGEFDVVLSSLAFHYLRDLSPVFRQVYDCLQAGGRFVFSMEHPVFTARAEQDWYYDQTGRRQHWPLDHYQEEGVRQSQFLGRQVVKYHRTTATILNTLIASGFILQQVAEPGPTPEILARYPEMQDEARRPIFLLAAAVKPGK